ncbi:hypothetical protein M878_23195 [Streptomyces roseochromogenus subsp. oscitans DS 12.976]|uniref:Uncharacterized protein n=1 Tax=Streptomyces roseochromogenus subsp. oscitans DS 12.976 TaxID=1352936 RepID=V6KGM9_STRRC|nr:hypothetical protein M878_23195 [Streptomyces roseochromogenus subsp. oscitans DS 12.976]
MEADPAVYGPRGDRGGGVGDGGLGVQDLADAVGAGGGRGDGQAELAEGADRRVEVAEEGGEREEPAEGHPAGGDLPHAQADHREHAQRLHDLDELRVHLAQPRPAHTGPHPGTRLALQPPLLVGAPVVGLGEDDVAERLLHHRGDRAVGDPLGARGLLDTAGEAARGEQEQRREDEGGQRQVPAQPEGGGGVEDGGEGCRYGSYDARDHQLLDGLDVSGEPFDQVALAVALEEVRGQVLDMAEDGRAQAQHESLRGPGGQGVAETADERGERGHAEPGTGRPPEGGQPAGLQGVVGQLGEQQDRGGLGERGHGHAGDDRPEPLAVPAGQRPEPAEGLAGFPQHRQFLSTAVDTTSDTAEAGPPVRPRSNR